MILIPGLTSPGSVWDSTVEHYRDRYTTLTLTLAGFAGLPPVAEPSLERVRNDLIDYLRANDLRDVVLVGHSIGGFLAYWVASDVPDRIRAVIALDGATWPPGVFDTTATPASAARRAEGLRQAIAGLTPDQFARQSDGMLRSQIKDSAAWAWLAPIAAQSDPPTTAALLADQYVTDLRDTVAAIRAPVLLLVATDGIQLDARTGYLESARRQVARIPQVEVLEVPRARHFIMLDDPAYLWHAMDGFLSRAGAP
jgi:N-formylmaleamate deformylase